MATESIARKALREVAGVADEPVALVNDHDGGRFRVAFRRRHEGRHSAAAGRPAADAARHIVMSVPHGRDASARKLASMKPASGGGSWSSPIATKASRLAFSPSGNSAASGAITCWRT